MSGELSPSEQLVQQLLQHQDDMFRFIYSLVGNPTDAWDLLQDTSLAIFRKAEEFDPQRPFLPWAFRFCRLTVMDWAKRPRRRRMAFDDDVLALLADERSEMNGELIERLRALVECLEELPELQRRLIAYRYETGATMDQVAERLGVSLRTLYRCMDAIRAWLHECISKRLAFDG